MKSTTSPYHLPNERYKGRQSTDYIVIHCAATTPSYAGGVEEIRRWHTEERGWIDVGYHFVIKRDGTIQPGRPIWAMGAHVAGFNHNSIGICLMGGINSRGDSQDNFTASQWTSLELLITALELSFYNTAEVKGHRDFPGVTKACPSFDVGRWYRDTFENPNDLV